MTLLEATFIICREADFWNKVDSFTSGQQPLGEALMAKVICANCDNQIRLDPDDGEGKLVSCEHCKATLKVITDGEYLLTEKTA